jgi:hypothetical protein
MKKFNIIILILFYPIILIGQNISTEKIIEDKAKDVNSSKVNVLVGLGIFNPNFELSNKVGTITIPFDEKIAKGLYLEFDYKINKKTSISMCTGAYFDTTLISTVDSTRKRIYQQSNRRYIPLNIQFKYNFSEILKTKLQPTIGLGIGGLNSERKADISDNGIFIGKSLADVSNNSIFVSTSLGLGYLITKKVGIFLIARSDYHFLNFYNLKLKSMKGNYEINNSTSYNVNCALSIKL